MILVNEGSHWRVITQNDHARLAADILGLWRDDGLPDHPRREALLAAVREHDLGWAQPDAAPLLAPEGDRPHDYLSLPDETRRELWHRAVHQRLPAEAAHAELLIVRHALEIHRDRRDRPEWRAFFDALELRREKLLAAGELDPATEAADYPWLRMADTLSLGLCGGWTRELVEGERRLRFEGCEVAIEPFPLAGATSFEVAYRRIPVRKYAGDADLGSELAMARWARAGVRVRPPR